MHSSVVLVAVTLVAFDYGLAVFCEVRCGCTTFETYPILSKVGSPFVDRFGSETSAFSEWGWLGCGQNGFILNAVIELDCRHPTLT